MQIEISIKKITIILLGISLVLVILNILLWILNSYGGLENVFGFLSFFDLDSEMNIPVFFNFFLLLSSSFLSFLTVFAKKKEKIFFKFFWFLLGAILFYIAMDELIQIHERLVPFFKTPPYMDKFLYFPWVIHETIFVLIVFLLLLKWLINLPKHTRNQFMVAGAVYFLGATVFEIIGGLCYSLPSFNLFIFKMISTIEESLEILGLIIFIRAILLYIKEVLPDGKIVFQLR